MKITPETNVSDLLSSSVENGAFCALREVVVQIRQNGTIRGMGVFHPEVESILYLGEMTDEEKKQTIAQFLPPWFAEITTILKKIQTELRLDDPEKADDQ